MARKTVWEMLIQKIPGIMPRLEKLMKKNPSYDAKQLTVILNKEFKKELTGLGKRIWPNQLKKTLGLNKKQATPEKKDEPEKKAEPKKKDEPEKKDMTDEEILKFFNELKTLSAAAEYFGKTEDEILKILDEKQEINCHELVSLRKVSGARVYGYFTKPKEKEILPKIFTADVSPDDSSCLLIKFPDTLDWRGIRVMPLAEVMIGDKTQHDEERFKRNMETIRKLPQTFTLLNGGIIALPPKGISRDDANDIVIDRIRQTIDILTPIAHKILWAHPGCTEKKMKTRFDIDPLKKVCLALKIPYIERPVNGWIVWKKRIFKFYCIHGVTKAIHRGSLIVPLTNILESLPRIDFLISSHQKSAKMIVAPRWIKDYRRRELVEIHQYLIITPSFLEFEGSEEEGRGRKPQAQGSLACILYATGDCGTSE